MLLPLVKSRLDIQSQCEEQKGWGWKIGGGEDEEELSPSREKTGCETV
jgi:hypothetical protein